MAEHNETGKHGEDLAVEFLIANGFAIFDRNYNYHRDEIDIVAYRRDVIHFVEVRTRKYPGLLIPEEIIDRPKLMKIARCAGFYLRERQLITVPTVFDLLAVNLYNPEHPVFRHFEDIYDGEQAGSPVQF